MTLGALNLRGSIVYHINGCLDEVAFCSRSLSPEEVFSHYRAATEQVAIVVPMDIKPGSYPNSINLKSNGVVLVAVLTTTVFDASTVVDPATVFFADADPVRWHL